MAVRRSDYSGSMNFCPERHAFPRADRNAEAGDHRASRPPRSSPRTRIPTRKSTSRISARSMSASTGTARKKRSCRLRVAQVWSGKNWGGQIIPRVGQEVVVEFLEGDPDRPLVIGTVYNDEYKPPYELPARRPSRAEVRIPPRAATATTSGISRTRRAPRRSPCTPRRISISSSACRNPHHRRDHSQRRIARHLRSRTATTSSMSKWEVRRLTSRCNRRSMSARRSRSRPT